jgi:hypothetical protein
MFILLQLGEQVTFCRIHKTGPVPPNALHPIEGILALQPSIATELSCLDGQRAAHKFWCAPDCPQGQQDAEKASQEIKRASEEVKREAGPKLNKATHELKDESDRASKKLKDGARDARRKVRPDEPPHP